jgi:hypothetical protein
MDIVTIIIAFAAMLGFVGLAWVGGYELGQAHGAEAARPARPTVKQLVNQLNNKPPRNKRRARK